MSENNDNGAGTVVDELFICEYCGKEYKTEKGIDSHIRKKHECKQKGCYKVKDREEFVSRTDTGIRIYDAIFKCIRCGKEETHQEMRT